MHTISDYTGSTDFLKDLQEQGVPVISVVVQSEPHLVDPLGDSSTSVSHRPSPEDEVISHVSYSIFSNNNEDEVISHVSCLNILFLVT